ELARSDAEREATERELRAARQRARARLDAAGIAVAAWQAEALEALRENVALATEAWDDGDIDFVTWLLVRREALDGRLDWIDALEELAAARAEWERVALP